MDVNIYIYQAHKPMSGYADAELLKHLCNRPPMAIWAKNSAYGCWICRQLGPTECQVLIAKQHGEPACPKAVKGKEGAEDQIGKINLSNEILRD